MPTAVAPITPWVDLVDVLKLYAPELIGADGKPIPGPATDLWLLAINEATWALFMLCAGKVHAEQCWVEDYATRGTCKVTLRRTPLINLAKVEIVRQCGYDIHELDYWDYCLETAQTINLCCGGSPAGGWLAEPWLTRRCGCQDEVVRVHYQVGSTLPPGTEARLAWLTNEYVNAATGQKCSLPERVTSVTRQGVSWTMLDPMDFLDRHLTGVGRIDSWLSIVRQAMPAAEYVDPLRSNRLRSELVSCAGLTPSPRAGPFTDVAFKDIDFDNGAGP